MGRLEQIIERNKHPRKHGRRGVTMGVGLGLFVFVILILMIFTDLDESPVEPKPETIRPLTGMTKPDVRLSPTRAS